MPDWPRWLVTVDLHCGGQCAASIKSIRPRVGAAAMCTVGARWAVVSVLATLFEPTPAHSAVLVRGGGSLVPDWPRWLVTVDLHCGGQYAASIKSIRPRVGAAAMCTVGARWAVVSVLATLFEPTPAYSAVLVRGGGTASCPIGRDGWSRWTCTAEGSVRHRSNRSDHGLVPQPCALWALDGQW